MLQTVFQFIPNLFSVVEIRALCWAGHSSSSTPTLMNHVFMTSLFPQRHCQAGSGLGSVVPAKLIYNTTSVANTIGVLVQGRHQESSLFCSQQYHEMPLH